MIQVNVHSRKNIVMRFMLHVRELIAEHPDVMIVNQGNCSDHRLVGALPKPSGSNSSRTRSRKASERFV